MQLVMQDLVAQAQVAEASKGTTMDTLNMSSLSNLLLLIPPLPEQDAILKHVSGKREPINTAISRLEREIELLCEYRTRLVADIVTGKLDVREAAARLPDEALPDAVEDEAELADAIDNEDADAVA
jgi:type I restriction enzyme S subunit